MPDAATLYLFASGGGGYGAQHLYLSAGDFYLTVSDEYVD